LSDVKAEGKFGIFAGSYHSILTKELKMHHACQLIVARMLMQGQCDGLMRISGSSDNELGFF
jgi:hypothetical protein